MDGDEERRRLVDDDPEDALSSPSDNDNRSREVGGRSTQVNGVIWRVNTNADCRDKSAHDEFSDSSQHGGLGYTRRNIIENPSLHVHDQVYDLEHVPVNSLRKQAGVGLTAQAGSIMVSELPV